ncbi:hypothetical protein DM02DRAFT_531897 [Periconia macrospinosa]|uniref:Zn(2)-C6 fungal-type domain-containing protein n=1 Tax=Periconia macrospinosa TaxID=97972 RepID=A0A2V1DIU0_9PLEO|nr:hypothetical protein DM02DRAFT_531897 [Periconia macrospinosa]
MSGLPHHTAPATATATTSDAVASSSSSVAMEAKEGRSGNAFACERCRKHKVRCVPSAAAGICQRCEKARVECIEHVARRRPAKPKTVAQTPSRMAELEKVMDRFSALVNSTPVSKATPVHPTLPAVNTIPSQVTEANHQTLSASSRPPPPPASKPPLLPAPGATPESAVSFWETINDTLSGLGRLDPVIRSISVIHMQLLLDSYRSMAEFFPFVTLPKELFVRDFIQQRPILMFAVLTAGSHDSPLLQLTLSREFRKVIMVKIMNGEKSLELLQGLLVFIAWHHHYMDAHAVSIRMLLQICVGIASDLGFDSISTSMKTPPRNDNGFEREAKRAYLGCYYLVSTLGLFDPGKPRVLSYSNTIRAYATDLASVWEHRSDAILPILVDTCQFMEDVEETFQNQSLQAQMVKLQLNRLNEKWEGMRQASQAQAQDYKTLQWFQLVSRIHMYKMVASLQLTDRDSAPWAAGSQLSQRITCLRSVEHFLDATLQLSSTEYEFVSIVDWLHLITALSMLGKLAVHSTPIPGWDAGELQIAKTFDYFRDRLCSIMPRPRDSHDSAEDLFESPNGSTFELATGSGRTVSLLQDLPKLNPIGSVKESSESLPTPWKISPSFDMSSSEFCWKFLHGTI